MTSPSTVAAIGGRGVRGKYEPPFEQRRSEGSGSSARVVLLWALARTRDTIRHCLEGPVHMSTTFAVGDLTIHRVIESEAPLFDPLTFFPTLTRELLDENLSWLRPTYIDPASGQLMLCIQSYVVQTKHHNILIDSCVGNHKERANYPFWNRMESDRYERNLAATGLTV